MENVYLLWFEQEQADSADIELLLGVYRTEEDARLAIERVKDQPGFRDFPDGFGIHPYTLNRDHWTQGFIRD